MTSFDTFAHPRATDGKFTFAVNDAPTRSLTLADDPSDVLAEMETLTSAWQTANVYGSGTELSHARAALHEATARYLRAEAADFDTEPAALLLDWDDDTLIITGIEDADGIKLMPTTLDEVRMAEMSDHCRNVHVPELAGMTPAVGSHAPYRLPVR